MVDGNGHHTIIDYDGNSNLVAVTDAMGHTTTIARRANGLIDEVQNPLGHRTRFDYDAYGNRVLQEDNIGNAVIATYDALGRMLSQMDADGYETTFTSGCSDQVLEMRNPEGGTTSFGYDANGNLDQVTDPLRHVTQWRFDQDLDVVAAITNPVGESTDYTYNADGSPASRSRPTGTVNYSYDASQRLVGISSSGATLQRDGNGNVIGMYDENGVMSFTYDALNRLTAATDYDFKSVGYAYDTAGNLIALTYAPGKVVTYTYYDDNSMHTVTDWLGHTTTYTYFSDGALQSISYGNNTSATFGYDGAGRLQDLVHRKSDASLIASYHFELDGRGNIITEDRQEPLSASAVPSVNESYTYNAANRLLSVGSRTYGYDGAGNMTSRSGSDPISCTYDLENRLTTISGSTNASFVYDTFGNRRSATRNGVTTKYVLDVRGSMSQVLMETDASGNPLAYYVYGVGLISRIGPESTPEYGCYHFNQVGSIVAVSGQDGVTLTHQYSYSPFGEIQSSSVPMQDSNPFRFGGLHGVMAEGATLLYMRARYYSPSSGRFLSEDPIWASNLYVFAQNNPVIYSDPTGLLAWKWKAAAGGAALGAASGAAFFWRWCYPGIGGWRGARWLWSWIAGRFRG
ncbi:MAG: RHS repeat protein [bacterium]|nr:RHS repeat protein [bacterium]